MKAPLSPYIPCSACRILDFHVQYREADGMAHVLCRGCGAELMAVTFTAPEEVRNTRVTPI